MDYLVVEASVHQGSNLQAVVSIALHTQLYGRRSVVPNTHLAGRRLSLGKTSPPIFAVLIRLKSDFPLSLSVEKVSDV